MSQPVTLLISSDASLHDSLRQVVGSVGAMTLRTLDAPGELRAWLDVEELVFVVLHLPRAADPKDLEPCVAELSGRGIPHAVVLDESRPQVQFIVMQMGAMHVFPRPLDLNRLAFWIDNLTVRKRYELQARAPAALPVAAESDGFLYHPAEMGVFMEQVRMVAPQQSTILIGGETGTGKTRLARLFHDLSNRRSEPFLVVNCATLSGTVIESELFGHVRGSFTGADRDRAGKFADVGKGTLFLDDIDTLPPGAQMKLLRAVEDRLFEPVGSNKPQAFHARLIAASNRNLEEEANQGRFRSDLFYRLNVVTFTLPPLRERRSMIAELAKKFIHEFAQQNHRPICGLSPEALESLIAHDWPGNIRELRNVIERAVALCPRPLIGRTDLPPALLSAVAKAAGAAPLAPGVPLGALPGAAAPSSVNLAPAAFGGSSIQGNSGSTIGVGPGPSPDASSLNAGGKPSSHNTLAETKDGAEMDAITRALAQAGNNKSLAAQSLGISRPTLYKKLRRYGLLGEGEE